MTASKPRGPPFPPIVPPAVPEGPNTMNTVPVIKETHVTVHHGLRMENYNDTEVVTLMSLYEELQLSSTDAATNMMDFWTFVMSVLLFGVIEVKIDEILELEDEELSEDHSEASPSFSVAVKEEEQTDDPDSVQLHSANSTSVSQPHASWNYDSSWDWKALNEQLSPFIDERIEYQPPTIRVRPFIHHPEEGIYSIVIESTELLWNYESTELLRNYEDDSIALHPLLMVAGFTKYQRARIQDDIILPLVPTFVLQDSHRQGAWVPLSFARGLAILFGCVEVVQPLFDYVPLPKKDRRLPRRRFRGRKGKEKAVEKKTTIKTRELGPVGFVYLASLPSTSPPGGGMGEVSIGIILAKQHRGYGYARKALDSTLTYAFNELKCHRVQASVIDSYEIEKVLSLFTQMKFTREGTRRLAFFSPIEQEWKNVTYMGMLATDWLMRYLFKPAPQTLWQEMFDRHERERAELLHWEERNIAAQKSLLKKMSTETVRAPKEEDIEMLLEDTSAEASTSSSSSSSSIEAHDRKPLFSDDGGEQSTKLSNLGIIPQTHPESPAPSSPNPSHHSTASNFTDCISYASISLNSLPESNPISDQWDMLDTDSESGEPGPNAQSEGASSNSGWSDASVESASDAGSSVA